MLNIDRYLVLVRITYISFQGTIEEKIYQRQISKQGLSGAVMDLKNKREAQFSREELRVSEFNVDRVQKSDHSVNLPGESGDP